MRVLVHTCCGPCGTYVFKRLREQGHAIKALYYNPNIHPEAEYERRRAALETYARREGIDLAYGSYQPREYWRAVGEAQSLPHRCERCYRLRLSRSAEQAKAEGFDAFTTTLLISPYQQHERLRSIGEDIARETGVPFHYEDYRIGYRESRELARQAGLYMQPFCGCAFSLVERYAMKHSP